MGTPVSDWKYQCRTVLLCSAEWVWGNAVHTQKAGAISIGTDPPGADFSFFNIIVVLSS